LVLRIGSAQRNNELGQLIKRLKVTFPFEHEYPLVYATLHFIRNKIFSEEGSMEVVPVCSVHRDSMTIHKLLECYNVEKEEQDDEDPRNVKVPETEGEHIIEGPELEYFVYA
jgi:hypothetical protein